MRSSSAVGRRAITLSSSRSPDTGICDDVHGSSEGVNRPSSPPARVANTPAGEQEDDQDDEEQGDHGRGYHAAYGGRPPHTILTFVGMVTSGTPADMLSSTATLADGGIYIGGGVGLILLIIIIVLLLR